MDFSDILIKNKEIIDNNRKIINDENIEIDIMNEDIKKMKNDINDIFNEACDLEKTRIMNIEMFIYSVIVIIFTMAGMYMNITNAGICLFSILNAIFVFGIGSKYLTDRDGIEKRVLKRLKKDFWYNHLNSKLLEKEYDISLKKEYIDGLVNDINYKEGIIRHIENLVDTLNKDESDEQELVENKGKTRVRKINDK